CPRVSFPGRAFPVKTFHLEDALELVRHRVDGSADWSRSSMAAQRRATRKAGENGPPPVPTQQEYSRRFPKHGDGVCSALAALDTEAINVQLIVELVTWYVSCGGGVEAAMDTLKNRRKPEGYRGESKGSAVLVFLPGTKEIQDVQEALQRTRELGSSPEQRDWVMQLHGSLPPDEQRRVFLRPPPGVIKGPTGGAHWEACQGPTPPMRSRMVMSVEVVLATNVAETSVTIDDVGVVIDSGRVKEERYLVERRMGSLEDVWVSKASAKQRRGRAGRVQRNFSDHIRGHSVGDEGDQFA
ncbi:P-loop containing nucleoside triphosphate hydrolase protein, partial [Baffinella frigidus]